MTPSGICAGNQTYPGQGHLQDHQSKIEFTRLGRYFLTKSGQFHKYTAHSRSTPEVTLTPQLTLVLQGEFKKLLFDQYSRFSKHIPESNAYLFKFLFICVTF